MAELTYRDAVARGIAQEMARDPDVVFLGEDVGAAGGVFKATVGLFEQFGPSRVRDTPISEQAILGAAMGAAMTGLKPIAEIMFSDFLAVCFDYIANEFPKSRYMTNGQLCCPLVVRTGNGARLALRGAALTERRELVHDDPGAEGRGPLQSARRDRADGGGGPRPRPGDLLRAQVALRDEGRGAGRRDRRHARHGKHPPPRQGRNDPGAGADGAPRACRGRAAAIRGRYRLRGDRRPVAGAARHADDPRLGRRRPHRLFTVEENPRLCGWGAEIVSIVADEAFYDLDGPPVRITTPHIPLPAADVLEDMVLPNVDRIVERVRQSLES